MRHRAGAFLTRRKVLLRLSHFRTLPVPNIKCKLIERGSDYREGAEIFRVTVALNDLCRHRCGRQPQSSTNLFFDYWVELGKGSHCTTKFSDRYSSPGEFQAPAGASHFGVPKCKSKYKRSGFSVNTMRATNLGRVLEFKRSTLQHVHEAVDFPE